MLLPHAPARGRSHGPIQAFGRPPGSGRLPRSSREELTIRSTQYHLESWSRHEWSWCRRRCSKRPRGGMRVIYYFVQRRSCIYLIDVYSKRSKENLTRAEENGLRAVARALRGEGQ